LGSHDHHQSLRDVSGLLEPCAVKVARTVLRGEGDSDATLLPGKGYEPCPNHRKHSYNSRSQSSTKASASTPASSSWKRCASGERSDKTVAPIARDLGVPERVLSRWRHELREQAERAFPGKGHQSELEEENRRLRRELELVKQEREVLKTCHGAQGDTPADENGVHSPAASRALRADA
jgi:transposase